MWIPITLAAATFQILRTARQHELRGALSTHAAGFVRFAYGAPLALVVSAFLFVVIGRPVPSVPARFWPTIAIAGMCQIGGTVALLAAFRRRDFAVGTVYSKSEVLLVAALGLVGVGDGLRGGGWLGAVFVTAGVVWLAAEGSIRSLLRRSGDPAALLGVVAAGGFAGAAVGIGAAARSLGGAPPFDRAVFTLTVLLVFQAAVDAVWLARTEPTALAAVRAAWRPAMWVGVFSLLGSIAWAWGFTLTSAAKVRTLGQVELLVAFLIARVSLGERHTRAELAAGGLVLVGVVVVAVWG